MYIKYKRNKVSSKFESEKRLDKIFLSIPLIEQFFGFNSNQPDYRLKDTATQFNDFPV